jgi:cytochrome d ubiquinol oxidase subunit II
LGLLYFIKTADDAQIKAKARKQVTIVGTVFVLGFVALLVYLFCLTGYHTNPATGLITPEPHKYLHNMLELVWLPIVLIIGVVLVLMGLGTTIFGKGTYSFWLTSVGVVLAVFPILISAAFNNTAYFVSTVNIQNSLTLQNSSSSHFTLKVMAYVSLLIPFVLAYIAYVWHQLTHKPMSLKDIQAPDTEVY